MRAQKRANKFVFLQFYQEFSKGCFGTRYKYNNNFVFFKIALNPIILYARTKAVHFKRQYPSSYFIHGDQILYVSHLYHNDENLFPQTWS